MFIKYDTISKIYSNLLEVKVSITSFKGTSIWTAFIQCFKKSLGLILIFEDIPRSKIWFQFLGLEQSDLNLNLLSGLFILLHRGRQRKAVKDPSNHGHQNHD